MATNRIGNAPGNANPAGLTDGETYIIQNKSREHVLRVYEGATYVAANLKDGVLLEPFGARSGSPNWLKQSYDSSRALRVWFEGRDATGQVEFIKSE